MTHSSPPPLLVDVRDGVLHLMLNRPSKRNALDLTTREMLTTTLSTVPDDIGAVVITGVDPAFCSGVDLTEMRELGGIRRRAAPPTDAIAACPLPVIAAVNGPCWTGGLELLLACDFAIASERATFGDTHVQFGMVSGWGGAARLPLAVGEQMAAQMLLTGEPIDAMTACRVGLVNEVIAHEALAERAHALAERIAAAPPRARDALVSLLRASSGEPLVSRLEREERAREEFTVDSADALDKFAARVAKN